MIEACQWVGDWGRAAEWTQALTNWCDEQLGLVAFTGQCAVHRAQLMRFTGAFSDAIAELERAVQRYEIMGSRIAVALAYVERGDVLRLLGDLDGADTAYTDAELHGGTVQLGRALLSLRRGNLEHAEAMVRRILHTTHGAIFRHQLIPGCVEVLMAAGCIDEASALAEELAIIAENFGCVAVQHRQTWSWPKCALRGMIQMLRCRQQWRLNSVG